MDSPFCATPHYWLLSLKFTRAQASWLFSQFALWTLDSGDSLKEQSPAHPAALIPRPCQNRIFTVCFLCHLLDKSVEPVFSKCWFSHEKRDGCISSCVSQLKSWCRRNWRRSRTRCTCTRTWREHTSRTCCSVSRWRSLRSWAALLNSCWQESTQWVYTVCALGFTVQ